MIKKDKPENFDQHSLNVNNVNNDQRNHGNYLYKTINCLVDRHHGWYTEMIPIDKQYYSYYKKHPCDYIVQTNYITNKINESINKSMKDNEKNLIEKSKLLSFINLSNHKMLKTYKTEKFRINLILRLRSIWSRSSLKSQQIESKHIHKSFTNHHQHQRQQYQQHHRHRCRHHHDHRDHHHHHHPHEHYQYQQLDKKDNNNQLINPHNNNNNTQSISDTLNNSIKLKTVQTRHTTELSNQSNNNNNNNNNIQILLSRQYHSESCLLYPYNMHNHIHNCLHIHYHLNVCSKSINKQINNNNNHNNIKKLSHQLSNIKLQSSYMKHSLTTNNICCLYTLNCVPSLECITQPISTSKSIPVTSTSTASSSPSTASTAASSSSSSYGQQQFNQSDYKCSNLPTTSIMLNRRNKKCKLISPFEKLKYHSFYRDTQCNLGKWIQQTLTCNDMNKKYLDNNKDQDNTNTTNNTTYNDNNYENELDNDSMNKNHSNNQFTDITNYLNYGRLSDTFKHVHFADESTYSSLTTLNSLSRSSSLCSSNYTNSSLSPQTSYTMNLNDSPEMNDNDDKNIVKQSISKDILFNHLEYPKKFLLKRTISSPKMNSNKTNTPFVTVNLFHNDIDLLETPLRVVNRLETEQKWVPTFPNPNQCINFNQRLIEQKVCLSQFTSQNLYSFNVQVKTIHNIQINHFDYKKEVKLRYTLDHWRTYTESLSLTCLDELTYLSIYNINHCIEINEGEIILSTIPLDTKFLQLEFAIVY
ncbi:unnamed protein product, partial [Schistosoma rodhaini]|uniref:CBM21 domain-containing protein n=1 Tax=Schistosoma rodhaini TaxID=6188 RepID=A0AA85FL51_9TREM